MNILVEKTSTGYSGFYANEKKDIFLASTAKTLDELRDNFVELILFDGEDFLDDQGKDLNIYKEDKIKKNLIFYIKEE